MTNEWRPDSNKQWMQGEKEKLLLPEEEATNQESDLEIN